ncbi:MAG: HAMP domain-containing sensor histidine kinase [Candidatus Gracilibacteria bacterium]|nr:HAMP domain-containing sensor histidine kinase [Candidatus Gracilibacteria bacterium]
MKSSYLLNKIKLKILIYGFSSFVFLGLLFQVILPLFGIYLFEKDIVFFLLPFMISLLYSSHKYSFVNIKFYISNILNFYISFVSSLIILNVTKIYFINLDKKSLYFWDIDTKFQIPDLFLGISLFLIFYNLFKKYVFGNNEYIFFIKKIGKLKNKISFISDFNLLNKFLNTELANLFKTRYIAIKLDENGNLEGLKEYFLKDKSNNLFINDIVFIEENKHKFNWDLISKEISENVYLVFPLINNNGNFLGILEIGIRSFNDIYYSQEIDLLRDFSQNLIIQLKHIEIYKEIQDINLNLDKKIDEKTIEYNNLLNRQKDFISIISHEIKSPLGACIFQVDSILDDIKAEKYDKKYLLKELGILNKYLINIGDLTKTMFSVEKYDLSKIQLFKQKIDINFLIYEKIEFYKKINKKIEFLTDIQEDIGYINIDKIQFSQVLDNLFVNAIKFISKENPKIFIKTSVIENNFIFEIEDNGKGFNGINPSVIFDKYVTGISSSIGIGMGMYLCKKIVELHNGNISADNAHILTGANFKIEFPLNID